MLMLMKAKTDAARMICLSTAVAADLADSDDDAKAREELFVPIAKAWSTDAGVEVASLGVQVHGGMGFIEETGAAQYYRDARIAPIYEGTNGIQAMDLAGRKLSLGNGAAMGKLIADMRATVALLIASELQTLAMPMNTGIVALEHATRTMLAKKGTADSLAAATSYLKLAGDVVGGWMHAKAAIASVPAGNDFAMSKLALAQFYALHILAAAPGLLAPIEAGAASMEHFPAIP
jgi:hypothetical protein